MQAGYLEMRAQAGRYRSVVQGPPGKTRLDDEYPFMDQDSLEEVVRSAGT